MNTHLITTYIIKKKHSYLRGIEGGDETNIDMTDFLFSHNICVRRKAKGTTGQQDNNFVALQGMRWPFFSCPVLFLNFK